MSERRVWAFVLAGLVLSVIDGRYTFTVPWVGTVTHMATVVGAAALALWVTLRRPRRAGRGPLVLIALALLLWSVGDAILLGWEHVKGMDEPAPLGSVDMPWLGAMGLFFAGVLIMVRRRAPGQLRGPTLDMLTITGALATAQFLLRYVPKLDEPDADPVLLALTVAYDIGDLLMAAVVLVLLMSPGRRGTATALLATAGALRIANAAALPSLDGPLDLPLVGDPFIIAVDMAYVLMAAALAHPRSGDLIAPTLQRRTLNPARLVFLGLAMLTGPLITFGRESTSTAERIGMLVATTLVTVCVLARVALAVRQQERAERTLAHQASHDTLTGLANRAAFTAMVEHSLRTEPESVICYIDLDGFKPINDVHGHDAGDAVLAGVADRLREVVRGGDLVARLGGDEFAVVAPGPMGREEADRLAARLLKAVEEPIDHHGAVLTVSASVGVAYARGTVEDDLERVLREADDAMYEAKRQGKGRWVFAPAAAGA